MKKKEPTIVPPATLIEMLSLINAGLKSGYGMKMHHILTATRGPDDYDAEIKTATTCIIRKWAFPAMAAWADVGDDTKRAAKIRDALRMSHFKMHARWAFDALGLEWGEVNKIKRKAK